MKKFIKALTVMLLFISLTACGDSNFQEYKIDDVLTAFKDAGLEAEDTKEMTKDDYGMAPMKAVEAKRFLIPSLGEDSGGRIFSFDNEEDLEQTKAYYDDLGKETAMLFSHTASNKNILIQINGDLEDKKFDEYKEVLNSLNK